MVDTNNLSIFGRWETVGVVGMKVQLRTAETQGDNTLI